jgi:hypothetical protein
MLYGQSPSRPDVCITVERSAWRAAVWAGEPTNG